LKDNGREALSSLAAAAAAGGGVTVWLGVAVESLQMKKRQMAASGNTRKQEADMRDWADRALGETLC
jgi:hypothetical protein